jgi:hypothetical protein
MKPPSFLQSTTRGAAQHSVACMRSLACMSSLACRGRSLHAFLLGCCYLFHTSHTHRCISARRSTTA